MTREIELTRGFIALVDDEDYPKVAGYKWYASSGLYTYARRNRLNGEDWPAGAVLMHRQILGMVKAPREVYIDHINGNGLDNRKANLRITDNKGNQGNRHRRTGITSQYRGVHFDKANSRFMARIKRYGITYYLGSFDCEIEAARAYDEAALEHFGEFANLNFQEGAINA